MPVMYVLAFFVLIEDGKSLTPTGDGHHAFERLASIREDLHSPRRVIGTISYERSRRLDIASVICICWYKVLHIGGVW